jgi:5-hydroxyisourate hydrolase-like protein (transthyretin family)
MVVVVSVLSLIVAGPQGVTHASISSCNGTIGPQVVSSGSSTDFQLQLTNNDSSNPIRWVEIDTPGGYFTAVNSVDAPGWSSSVDSNNYVTLTGGAINPGDTFTVTVNATAFHGNSPPTFWYTHITDDPGGSGSTLCDGDLNTQIVSNVPPPTISNIQLSNLTPHAVTISWQTDTQTTGQLAYSSAGDSNTLTNSTPTSFHSFDLTNLVANTSYHYQITADDGEGNVVTSGDNTFLTPVQPPPPPPPFIINNIIGTAPTTGTVPGVTIKATPSEKVPPTISLTSDLSKPFKLSPAITGRAADNAAVARVEYSIDGGKDWIPVDHVATTNGGQTVTFTFTPIITDDGNYQIEARAIDSSANVTATPAVTLVIDRLPPQLGPLVVSYGPDVLSPDDHGIINLVAGSDYKLTTSAVGGPTSINIEADLPAQTGPADKTFAMTQSADSGLWNGLLSFKKGGVYHIVARSVDGAGNRTARQVMTVSVNPPGHVTDAQTGKAVAGATVTLYYLEPSTKTWQVWNGAPYSQINPQHTTATGTYSLEVPQGTYYLQTQAPLHHTFVSDSFTVTNPLGLVAMIPLGSMVHLGPLHLPDIAWQSQPLHLTSFTSAAATGVNLAGTNLPDFTLPTLAGGQQTALGLEGRPTVLSILATWSPDSQDQLAALEAAQGNHDVNVVPVFSQEHLQLVSTYLATSGSHLTGLVDADGVLVPSLQIGSLPEHVFVDRDGRIKKVMLGVLSKDELLNQLGGL